MSLPVSRRLRRAAVVSVTALSVLVAVSGAGAPAATAEPKAERLGPEVPTGSFVGPVHGMSPLHSARSTSPLARKYK